MKRHRLKITEEFRKVFFTADLHLGHANLLAKPSCPRLAYLASNGLLDERPPIDLMGEEIIRQWNETVPQDATVFLLGDASFKTGKSSMTLVSQLHGAHLYMLRGNHDKYLPTGWTEGWDGALELSIKDPVSGLALHAHLSHYPFAAWKESHYGTWCLHGHCHGCLEDLPNRFDVGVDTALMKGIQRPMPFAPYSVEELLRLLGEPRYWGSSPLVAEGHHHSI